MRVLAILMVCGRAAAQNYPACVQNRVVLRHAEAHAIFVDLTNFGAAGCWQNDCKHTDKFNTGDQGLCARACSQVAECEFWSYGEQEGAGKCFLRKSDGGREETDGFTSGAKSCAPADLPPAFVAYSTADLEALRNCDGGKSEQCPDLARAVQTWRYAISHLQKATEGQLDENTLQYVNQIHQDTEAFAAQMNEENFPVVVGNNRQVFNALWGWLQSQPQAQVDQNDASLAHPLRGQLCGPRSCYEL